MVGEILLTVGANLMGEYGVKIEFLFKLREEGINPYALDNKVATHTDKRNLILTSERHKTEETI